MQKILFLVYGLGSYCLAIFTNIYLAGFLGNFLVKKSIDSLPQNSIIEALLIDFGLIVIFCLQHSIMARKKFKGWLTKLLPPVIERSTYVLLSSLSLLFLCWQWRPIGGMIWQINNPIVQSLITFFYVLSWLFVITSSFYLNHFDLFGLRQVYLHFQSQEYSPLEFTTPALYQYLRHPIYLGWLIVFWLTPVMTITHLLLALSLTIYILIGIKLEEQDLINFYGDKYNKYRQKVPMLIPNFIKILAKKK